MRGWLARSGGGMYPPINATQTAHSAPVIDRQLESFWLVLRPPTSVISLESICESQGGQGKVGDDISKAIDHLHCYWVAGDLTGTTLSRHGTRVFFFSRPVPHIKKAGICSDAFFVVLVLPPLAMSGAFARSTLRCARALRRSPLRCAESASPHSALFLNRPTSPGSCS